MATFKKEINNQTNCYYTHLHIKAMRSAALPEPSQTTTGTGGSSVTYSSTALMVLVPPSITRQTMGIGLCVTVIIRQLILLTRFTTKFNLQGYNLCLDMYFSSLRLKMISAPYLATVPLSTSRKYACRLFKAAILDLSTSNHQSVIWESITQPLNHHHYDYPTKF